MARKRHLRIRNSSPSAKKRRLESMDEEPWSEEKDELEFDEETESEPELILNRRRKKRRLRKKSRSPSPKRQPALKHFSIVADLFSFVDDSENLEDESVDSDNFIVEETGTPVPLKVLEHQTNFISSSDSDSEDDGQPDEALPRFFFEMQLLKTIKECRPTVPSIETKDFWNQNKRIYSEFLALIVTDKYLIKSREQELILTFGIVLEMLKESSVLYESGVVMSRLNCHNEEYALLREISNILHPAPEEITESEIHRYRQSFLSLDAIHLGSERLLEDMEEDRDSLHQDGCSVPLLRELYGKATNLFLCKNFRRSPSREKFMEFLKYDPRAEYRIRLAARQGQLEIRLRPLSLNPRKPIKTYFRLLNEFNESFPPETKGNSKEANRILIGTDSKIQLGNRKQYSKARMQRIAEVHESSPDDTIPLLRAMSRVMCATCLGYPRVFRYRMLVPREQEENSQFSDEPFSEVKDEKSEQEEKSQVPRMLHERSETDLSERLVPPNVRPEGWGVTSDEEEDESEDEKSDQENMDSFLIGGRCNRMDRDRKHSCKCGERISLGAKITKMLRNIGEFVPGNLLNSIGARQVSRSLFSDFFRVYIAACIQLSKETLDLRINSRTATKAAPTEWEQDHGIL